jgi:hypothetical protein
LTISPAARHMSESSFTQLSDQSNQFGLKGDPLVAIEQGANPILLYPSLRWHQANDLESTE